MVGGVTLNRVWLADVLNGIGAPASENNEAIISRWAHWEGSRAAWNALDTTRPADGAWPYNVIRMRNGGVIHVWNYPDERTGAAATAATIRNGHYPAVLAALRADAPLSSWRTAEVRAEVRLWGTGGFARELGTPPR